MGCIIEFLFEFVAEVVFESIAEIFMYLSNAIFPDKIHNEKLRNMIEWISVITSILMFALFMFGLIFFVIGLVDGNSLLFTLGWILLTVSLTFIVAGIIVKLVKGKKK